MENISFWGHGFNLFFLRFPPTPGMDAELFFVRHGVVNHYALTFVIPVPEQVDDLTFSWQSLVDIPVSV